MTWCTGGTVSEVQGYRIHTFTSNGTLTVVTAGFCELLLIGGGGGGAGGQNTSGGDAGGGGGAGGFIAYHRVDTPSTPYFTLTTGAKSVVIGAGGLGVNYVGVCNPNGDPGYNSKIGRAHV